MSARKALLVGINDYSPTGAGGPDLRGCINDVRDMATTLNALGVVPANPAVMRIITDGRATREAMLAGLRWLVGGAKRGDVLIFYYSGHGSQVVDIHGDEPDQRDETICPHDFAKAGMITDDDMRAIFSGLPGGVHLDAFLDSCHSGSGTREALALCGLPDDQTVAPRYVEPPLDYGFFVDLHPSVPMQGLLKWGRAHENGKREAVELPKINHVLWSGCRDNQTSSETCIDGQQRGIFTYCFCKAIRRAGLTITRRRLDGLVSNDIKKMGFGQVPQLEGSKTFLDEKVFT